MDVPDELEQVLVPRDQHGAEPRLEDVACVAVQLVEGARIPAVQRVQILVEGKEVDTIAGHVDVRRPLERDSTLVRDSQAEDQRKTRDSQPQK